MDIGEVNNPNIRPLVPSIKDTPRVGEVVALVEYPVKPQTSLDIITALDTATTNLSRAGTHDYNFGYTFNELPEQKKTEVLFRGDQMGIKYFQEGLVSVLGSKVQIVAQKIAEAQAIE